MIGDKQTAPTSVVLVGNPNVGKSAVFGALTGQYVVVSNYPGTTVEISRGSISAGHRRIEIIDTPGINSLIPMSEDERVTRDIVLDDKPKVVVQVADSKNLQRALIISSQLAEFEIPFILVLNMADEAAGRGIKIDTKTLSQTLGVPVVETVATEKRGIENIIANLPKSAVSTFRPVFSRRVEDAISGIISVLGDIPGARGIAISILSCDESLIGRLKTSVSGEALASALKIRDDFQSKHRHPTGYVIQLERAKHIEQLLRKIVSVGDGAANTSRRLSSSAIAASVPLFAAALYGLGVLVGFYPAASVLALPMLVVVLYLYADKGTHPVFGIPIVAVVLYLTWLFVGKFGAGVCVDFLESIVFGKYINPVLFAFVKSVVPWQIVRDLFIGDYGIIPMAVTYAFGIVMPIVAAFFVVFGLLEDSGYLPRLAVVADRVFKLLGLSGKAVLPMVLGLGCGTMAILTTRILEGKRERLIVTLLLALGIPCSAQLGVIMGMLGSTGVPAWCTVVWGGVVAFVILIVGFLAGRIMPGDSPDFILEIPPVRMPHVRNIAVKTYARVKWYVKEAVPLFAIGAIVLFTFDKTGLLSGLEKAAQPVVQGFLGLPPKVTETFIIGFLRRDYGAAALFQLARSGLLDSVQIVVSVVTLTLFVPCLASFLMIIKERGVWTAIAIFAFIVPFAIVVGGALNAVLRAFGF